MNKTQSEQFITLLAQLSGDIHDTNVAKGFWDGPQNHGEKLALIHAEVSEALEAVRRDIQSSDHIPQYLGVEEELADVVIRVLDYAYHNGFRLGPAILDKLAFNKTRPVKHGGKRF